MKEFDVLTIFPELIECYLIHGVIGKALNKGLAEVKIHNLRDFTSDKHKKVDDYSLWRRSRDGNADRIFL